MADLQVYKFGIEMLSKTPTTAHTTRQDVEVFAKNVANQAQLNVYKFGIEVLSETPLKAGVTKQDVEVFAKNVANQAQFNVYKFGIEVLSKTPVPIKTTRQDIEVFAKNVINDAQINIYKFGFEVLSRTGPILTNPKAEPTYWNIFFKNWADNFVLSTAYKTNISMSQDTLTEARKGLLEKPLRTASFKWSALERKEYDKMRTYLRKLTDERNFAPIYSDFMVVNQTTPALSTFIYCDPTDVRLFKNQRIAIVKQSEGILPSEDFNPIIREVDSISVNRIDLQSALPNIEFTANQYIIFPLFDVHTVLEPTITFGPGPETGEVELTVQEIAGNSTLPASWTGDPPVSFYGDYPIFTFEPNWTEPPKISYLREGSIDQKGHGLSENLLGDRYRYKQTFEAGFEREDAFNLIKFFDSRRGRLLPFWMVDHDYSWRFAAISGPSLTFIDLEVEGDFTEFTEDHDYIGIIMSDGTAYVRETASFSQVGDLYRVTVTSALPSSIIPRNVVRVSRARLSRFLKDELEENWITSNWMQTEIATIELLEESDVELT